CRAVAMGDPISAHRPTWFQQKSRNLRRRMSRVAITVWLIVLIVVMSASGVALSYYERGESANEFSARIEKFATPYSSRVRQFNEVSNTALAQKLAFTMKRSDSAPLWRSLVEGMPEEYETLEKLRKVAYDEGYPTAFDDHFDRKKWARIQGMQASIEAFQSDDAKTLLAKYSELRATDAKLVAAIVAMRRGQREQSIKGLTELDAKSGNIGRIARFALALYALEKNDFEDGLGRLEQLRDVEGFAEPALGVLMREWPRAFVYTAFTKDESSIQSNLNTQFKQMRDFAKTIPDSKLFWQNANNEINAQFLKEGLLKDRRRRIARVFETLKAKSLIVSEIKCPRLTRALHLALARRIESRYDDKFPAEMRKALFHHLSIQSLDENYELPKRYQRVLSGLAMGSMMASHREAYNDVLVVTRAGIYLPYIRTFVLDQFERNNLLDGPVAQNPADFAARFWRGMIGSLDNSQKREQGMARVKVRIETSLSDLGFVINNTDTPAIFRAIALLQRADLRIEKTLLDRQGSSAKFDKELFDSLNKDCQEALKSWHPEPDRVYELLMRLESRYKGMKESTVEASTALQIKYAKLWVESIEERQRRTNDKILAKGRPRQSPLADMVGYRNKLRSAFTSLSRAYQKESKYELAAEAALSAINCAAKSDEKSQMFECLYELIESQLKLNQFEKAKSAYREYYLNKRYRSEYSKSDTTLLEGLWRASKQQVPGKKP
ncbi:MAG: hypothetical protein P1V97_25175, partial [Planctomycetota bacterium]|nr:hypothetical protein [Planctomycetota bacterium]